MRWARLDGSLARAPVANLFLVFLLLAPVLNPWYAIWLVPFVAINPTRSELALLVVVPLSYATGLNLADPTLATYAQPAWVRPIEFGIVILAALSSLGAPTTHPQRGSLGR